MQHHIIYVYRGVVLGGPGFSDLPMALVYYKIDTRLKKNYVVQNPSSQSGKHFKFIFAIHLCHNSQKPRANTPLKVNYKCRVSYLNDFLACPVIHGSI